MWYNYKKHQCEKCENIFQYSQDTMTMHRGTECPTCGQKFEFDGIII